MRTLNNQEMKQVSGGTLCLLSGLVKFKVSLLRGLLKSPCKTSCAPAPAPTPVK